MKHRVAQPHVRPLITLPLMMTGALECVTPVR
jgi:hypothetical protein